ncbi:hypothetical protein FJY63_11385, partial [Candidatus Sumerlaeota bacterium]|nr:hypothetical protein [Candidatus Sumerlaeota bacterium]
KVGEAVAIPWRELRGRSDWLLPCAFAQSDLTRAVHHLLKGKLWLPGYGVVGKMALCPLSDLGSLGPEGRDIHDGFVPSEKPTAYRAFWGHDAETMVSLAQEPNRYLSALAKAKPGRPLRKVCDLWPLAAKVLIADCLRLNTQALTAARVSQPVLSNVWWSFAFKRKRATAAHEKALVLWLNSTPGLLMMLARRGETMGAWVRFKKPALKPLPVLDMRALSRNQLNRLSFLYNRVADQALLPLPQMNTDDVRAEIDREIAKTLRIPDFSILREMLAREPIVCLRPL